MSQLMPPFREEFFQAPGILSKIWTKYFIKVATAIEDDDTNVLTNAINTIGEVSSRQEDQIAVVLLPRSESSSTLSGIEQAGLSAFLSEKSSSSRDADSDLLTLYWVGV
jgi:hypothetical protein